ncbi:type IX secretion system outer membrane channel protein PorV [uncultured Dokdonia sp.]|uniref:type IX secretion system outer membrane channel protein PorV n=1 Tax=unclassified Dokdonia TaxID=2615033 RepID=UPI002604E861|nr:type IX secretion system outer membrane channel protein PorV [uncultured Dokdonia sp.]
MNKVFTLLGVVFCSVFATSVQAQDQPNTITTAVPFLIIAGDARAAGMGEQGVATSPDAYAVQWNPAKLAFLPNKHNVGINYTPYLGNLVNDIGLLQAVYANRIDDRSAFAASVRYFSLGTINTRNSAQDPGLDVKPNEFSIDATYALKLDDQFSMAVSGRFLQSNLRLQQLDQFADASPASSFGVDISGYYQSEEQVYSNFDGRWRAGFNISNIGPKVKYDDAGQENFIPTNLKLGGGFDFILDSYNKIFVGLEFNKLLVPTPPIRGRADTNGDGEITQDDDVVILAGQDDDVNFFSGIFQSFGDAPDGFSEELKEVTWSLATEYTYNDVFALRAGYFNESELKGSRKFATLGAGFEFNAIDVDLSYLFSTGSVISPLESTLRFGLTFHFGDEYDEY